MKNIVGGSRAKPGSRVRFVLGNPSEVRKSFSKWLFLDEYYLLLAYIVSVGFLGMILLLASKSKDSTNIPFIDALFNSMSACTGSGLATVTMSDLTYFQLTVLMLLCLFGGKVFTTLLEALLRLAKHRHAHHNTKQGDQHILISTPQVALDVPNDEDQPRRSSSSFRKHKIFPQEPNSTELVAIGSSSLHQPDSQVNDDSTVMSTLTRRSNNKVLSKSRPYSSDGDVLAVVRLRHKKLGSLSGGETGLGILFEKANPIDYEVNHRSGSTLKETRQEKEDEDFDDEKVYKLLGWTIFSYWFGLQTAAAILARIYIAAAKSTRTALKARNNMDATFYVIFMAISHFANAGFSPINDSMMPFMKNTFFLFIFAVQMLFGNTLFPLCLRTTIWTASRWLKNSDIKSSCRTALKQPRKYCSMLYPRGPTIWFSSVTLVCVFSQMVIMLALMWKKADVTGGLSGWEKVFDAWFQAVSCRHTGVNVWNVAAWSPTVLFLFIMVMYIPSQPLHRPSKGQENSVFYQVKKFTKPYAVFLGLAALIVCFIENKNINNDPANFSILNILFEVVSGGMNVGLSIGYTCALRKEGVSECVDVPYSFVGKWSPLSKFVMVVVMVVGRIQ